ncbi:uncharacterized protein J3R85_001096 [Psidium guajava]|nr:uncharacterized protein J3R85_001096 [Psidium guajava]
MKASCTAAPQLLTIRHYSVTLEATGSSSEVWPRVSSGFSVPACRPHPQPD